MEERLIEEMAKLRGGPARLKAIRREVVQQIETLEQMLTRIDEVCACDDPEMTESVDSIVE